MNIECPHHEPGRCPDAVVYYSQPNKVFGIRVQDGGSSYLIITFCPWCGRRLKK